MRVITMTAIMALLALPAYGNPDCSNVDPTDRRQGCNGIAVSSYAQSRSELREKDQAIREFEAREVEEPDDDDEPGYGDNGDDEPDDQDDDYGKDKGKGKGKKHV